MKTIEEVELMSSKEWEQFRQTEWDNFKTNKKSTGKVTEMPSYYLHDKKSYISFIKAELDKFSEKDRERLEKELQEIDKMDDKQWADFRVKKWEDKQKTYSSATPPSWFMTKDSYINFIKTHQSIKKN